ncbi:MAG TPA: kelch repeat-containing protein [Anaerolineaceae bacterium]|nr:kelch repeat-containing protein [Anaerolineaceae bacterium]
MTINQPSQRRKHFVFLLIAILFTFVYLFHILVPVSASSGNWITINSMNYGRYYHTATSLSDGRVLITGGVLGLANSELFNPATGIWTSTGSMNIGRSSHVAILLSTGKVLVAGGFAANGDQLRSAELFDPSTGMWTITGAMNNFRYFHTATLLQDGRVLVAGGQGGGLLSSAELYDPLLGIWTITGSLNFGRQEHTATLLNNGKVLVVGGNGSVSSVNSTAELYDPDTGTWTVTGTLENARIEHTASLLSNGKVLVTGGSYDAWKSSELYDPILGTWGSTGSMNVGRALHTAILLPNDRVLVVGGCKTTACSDNDITSAELYDPTTGIWTTTGSTHSQRYHHTSTLLSNGQVLVTGGFPSLSSAEIYGFLPDEFSKSLPVNGFTSKLLDQTLSWEVSSGATSYQYCVDTTNDNTCNTWFDNGTNTSVNLIGLSPNTTYFWQAKSINNFGATYANGSDATFWSFTIDTTPPPVPTLNSPNDASLSTDNTPDFSWVTAIGSDHFQIQISLISDFTSTVQDATLSSGILTYTATILSDNLYYWRVRAFDLAGNYSDWSTIRTLTIDTSPPVAPLLISPIDSSLLTDSTPDFSWGTVVDSDHFQFQISLSSSFATTVQDIILAPSVASYTATLLNDSLYYWRVRAIDLAGNNGAWSSIRSFSIDTTPPVAPELISPPDLSTLIDKWPTFSWNLVSDSDHFQIQISLFSDFSTTVQDISLGTGILTYTSSTLSDNNYFWRVRAIDLAGNYGAWSVVRSFTLDSTPPAAPVLLTPTAGKVYRGTPSYSWTTPLSAVAYIFQYDNDDNFSSPVFTSTEMSISNFTPPLQAVGIYFWHVKARDQHGNWSNWSYKRKITIKPVIPVAPTLVSPKSGVLTRDNTPTFSWKAVPYGFKYQVQILDKYLNVEQDKVLPSGLLSLTATTLPDGKHYWRVRAINVLNENGAWTLARALTIDTVSPVAPKLVSPSNGFKSPGTPEFTWKASNGAKYYQFSYSKSITFITVIYTSSKLTSLSFTPPTMKSGTFYWRVRCQDAAGNWSKWSTPWKVSIY